MEDKEKIDSFIALLEQKKAKIKEDRNILANVLKGIQSILERYYDNDSMFVKQIVTMNQYVGLLQKTKKDQFLMYPRCSTKEIVEDATTLIESVIEEVKTIGLPKLTSKTVSKDITINNTQNQTQNQQQIQQQDIVAKILLEAVRDELKGKELKELYTIIKEAKDPQEAHKSFVEKFIEYGTNVSASIVANILTNPKVWEQMGTLSL